MEIVQIVLDKKLLQAADQAARRTKCNRLELRATEERDRQGYSLHPQAGAEIQSWESEATWPDE
jgi:hypothetical protein